MSGGGVGKVLRMASCTSYFLHRVLEEMIS